MTVKSFVEYWHKQGFTVRIRTVKFRQTLVWCFTGPNLTFFIPASAIVTVADAIEKYGKA